MRSQDGKHFENVVGVTDFDRVDGTEFEGNVLDCEKPMGVGDKVLVGDRPFEYHGEDSLGRSVFTRVGQPIADVLFGTKAGIPTF
jgi:hypothetical protein